MPAAQACAIRAPSNLIASRSRRARYSFPDMQRLDSPFFVFAAIQ